MPEVLKCLQSLTLDDDAEIELDSEVSNTGYTVSKVLSMVSNDSKFIKLSKNQKLVKITARDISDGKGYCSRVFKTVVYFDKGDKFNFMMKIPTDDAWNEMDMGKPFSEEEKKKNKRTLVELHNSEVDTYELLAGMIEPFPIPKIYHMQRANDESAGIIVMEDLSDHGQSLGAFYSATPQQCYNIARHMADLQYYFDFLPDKAKWLAKFPECIHCKADITELWVRSMHPILKYEDKDLVNVVQMYIDMDIHKLGQFALIDYSEQFECNTILHGDLWMNNMLVKSNENSSMSDEILAFIDWQTCFIGSPCFDIVRFISNCTEADTRRQCERKALDVYYDRLTENYAKRGQKPKFTREQAYEFYDLGLVQQVGLLIFMFGLLAMPLKDSEDEVDKAKVRQIASRLKMAANDAMPVIEKYQFRTRFAANQSE
ncbi:hypothetical protein M3Y98_01180300 [Aphelenchoides besseyi]|nr:hypothetical protein M3Y98_01180300 [Aphelenchoides besseyi]